MIHLESYGARNWMKSVPTTCFGTYGFLKAISRRPVMVSERFQRGLKPRGFRGVSEGSETAVSEGFQRGLKPCGFRGVSKGSETVWPNFYFLCPY